MKPLVELICKSLLLCGLAAGCFLFSTCRSSEADSEDYDLSTLETDSIAFYQIPGKYADQFMFSPLREDAIWLIGDGEKSEVDLQNGAVVTLDKVLRTEINGNLRPAATWIDPFRPHSFWYEAQGRQLAIYRDSAHITFLPTGNGNNTATILFEKDQVWIGGGFGLKRYNRSTNTTVSITNLPATWISTILPANDGSGALILNNNIHYDPKTGQWEPWSVATDCQDLRPRIFDGMHLLTTFSAATAYTDKNGVVQALPWYSNYVGGPICANGHLLWTSHSNMDTLYLRWFDFIHQNKGEFKYASKRSYSLFNTQFASNGSLLLTNTRFGFIIFNRENNDFRYIPFAEAGNARQMQMDSRNLYLLTEHRFIVISLNWLMAKGVPMASGWGHDEAFEAGQKAYYEQTNPIIKDSLYKSLLQKFGNAPNPFFQEDFQRMKQTFLSSVDISDKNNLAWIEQQIAAGELDSAQLANIFAGYSKESARKLDIEKALYYARKYVLLGGQKDWIILQKLKTFQWQRDSIKALQLPEDAYAYAYGKILENYCSGNDAFESSSMYNLGLATDQYLTVVKKHPTSQWADNAAFDEMMIDLFNYCEGGCDYSLEDVKRLDRFVKKYPDSENVPDVWLAIAGIYPEFNTSEGEYDATSKNALKNARLGLAYLSKIKEHYPEFVKRDDFKYLEAKFQENSRLYWSLDISFNKNEFQKGEPIVATLIVTNINDSTQALTTRPGGGFPLISMEVGYMADEFCQKQSPPFSITGTYKEDTSVKAKFEKIPGHGSRKWTLDLTKTPYARIFTYGSEGVYDFSKAGTYFSTLVLRQQTGEGIHSKEMKFVVK